MLAFLRNYNAYNKIFSSVVFNRSFKFIGPQLSTCDDDSDDNSSCDEIKASMEIPDIEVYENNPKTCISIKDFCEGRKIILIGVPGAFTPVCLGKHLPEYIEKAEEFKKLGVDELACISVNDPYVMNAWGKHHDAKGKVRMFADPQANLTKALGVPIEIPFLGGIRSKRYSMVLCNGTVQEVNVEPDGVGLRVSRAACLQL